jgi:hypothetical protein
MRAHMYKQREREAASWQLMEQVAARHRVQAPHNRHNRHPNQVAATCKHFFGYSLEMSDGQSRYSYNAQINSQVRRGAAGPGRDQGWGREI